MKNQFIALRKYTGRVSVGGTEFNMNLPERCTGLFFCFENKKSARKYWGKDVGLIEIEIEKKGKK